MAENRNTAGLNEIFVEDERYPVNVNVGNVDKFTLYFNPADPFLKQYCDRMQELQWPDSANDEAYNDFISRFEEDFDAIFGTGSARLVCRHIGVRYQILEGMFTKVREGIADFEKKAKVAQNEDRLNAILEAKKQAAPYIAPVK